jgi:hypothetical protein
LTPWRAPSCWFFFGSPFHRQVASTVRYSNWGLACLIAFFRLIILKLTLDQRKFHWSASVIGGRATHVGIRPYPS